MDIRVFKTFIQVAKTKHFGHAAENLYITQAAVSARIKQLEEFYGTQLFIRDKNNLRLTPSGETLLAHAHLMIEQLEQSKQAITTAKKQKTQFTIAATPNVWDAFFSSRIQETIDFFSEVSLGTEISVREVIQRKLGEKTLDVGLLTDPIKDEDFTNTLIGHFELALVSTSENHLDVIDHYILVDWGLTFLKEHALHHKLQPSLRTSAAMIALEVLLSRGGFAYLPLALVSTLITNKTLYKVETPLLTKRPIYMVTKNQSSTSPQNELLNNYGSFLKSNA
ncbi:LysR family transcriptional regulator [Colwellia asteriadis]|uniref:LysR family transcriptional regulator n=1 Tax=Colwellia asteriadis TaxID=517723 RepID=A0ABN1L6Y2_9GAMM